MLHAACCMLLATSSCITAPHRIRLMLFSISASCLDILPEQCEQGDEEDLMYKPFPDCCPVYCNLKRRMQRLRTMHFRHRILRNMQDGQGGASTSSTSGDGNTLLSEIGYNNY